MARKMEKTFKNIIQTNIIGSDSDFIRSDPIRIRRLYRTPSDRSRIGFSDSNINRIGFECLYIRSKSDPLPS